MSRNTVMHLQKTQAIESLVAQGDLSQLSPQQRASYYLHLCQSLNLNPALLPFEYIKLNGKLVLYAKKACADQLRFLHGVSIYQLDEIEKDDLLIVTAYACTSDGRTDCDQGVVSLRGLQGDLLANARMKAITKAKRRVTLSLCGLGMLDESELSTIGSAQITFCQPDTMSAIQRACDEAQQRGATVDDLRALLPDGLQSRQQLTEAQGQLFIEKVKGWVKGWVK